MATHKAHATPTKDFFVRMITKDISLEDCILDLIDNCLDGARKVLHATRGDASSADYSAFSVDIEFSAEKFGISDNCGGITIGEAIDYAFHFGRRADAPMDGDSIGLYGIGMKRAIFKMGNKIEIHSSTDREAFRTPINVGAWLSKDAASGSEAAPQPESWDFDMEDAELIPGTGTRITIAELHAPIAADFENPAFQNGLARIVGRDYAQFLAKGFAISLNGTRVEGFPFAVGESDDFKPIHLQYTDESGIEVDIVAGMAGAPPEDLQPTEQRAETDYYGWFVLCNERVIVAADKGRQTVWGDNGFPAWHYQYNGFIGVVSFHSRDPRLLPWKTTKRDVDDSNPAYRRAIEKMKEATRAWIKYTNDRRANIEEAKRREAAVVSKPLFSMPLQATLGVPRVAAASQHVKIGNILYTKPLADIVKAATLLGNKHMPYKEVGSRTFDYFLENEGGG